MTVKSVKIIIFILTVISVLIFPLYSFAEESTIYSCNFDSNSDDILSGWQISKSGGTLSVNKHMSLSLTEDGYIHLVREFTFEPSSTYEITLDADAIELWGSDIGINFGFKNQSAQASHVYGNDSKTIKLYIQTNLDENQTYTFYMGIGNESEPVNGSAVFTNLTIKKINELPPDTIYYSLIGSFEYEYATDNNISNDSLSSFTYNDIGILLFFSLFIVFLYFLFTGKFGLKFSFRISGKIPVILIFTAAFILRVYLSKKFDGHITDLNNFKAWAINVYDAGISAFYESGVYADHPPLYMYLLYIIGFVSNLLKLDYNSYAFKLLIELPAVISDLLLAFFAYRLISKKNKNIAVLSSLFLLFSPAVITTSVAWGQINSVITLLSCLCIYFLNKKKKILATVCIAAACMINCDAFILVPILLVIYIIDIFIKENKFAEFKSFILSSITFLLFIFVISLPMKGNQSPLYIFRFISTVITQYSYATMNAFNLWGLLGMNYHASSTLVLGIPTYNFISLIAFIIVITCFSILYAKRKCSDKFMLIGCYLLSITMLCCNIKERSPYLAVILLTIAAFNSNSKKIFSSVTSLNILLYVNIYLVLIFRAELIYTTVTSIFSLLYLLTFIYVTYTIITNSYTSHKILNADKNVELLSVSIHQSAIKRLSSKPDNNRKINRRDLIVVTCITLIYGIIALTNLGSTTIPAESPVLSETANSTIIVDMGENHNISQMKYYSGYCEGDFTLSTSSDGQNYYPIIDSNISHRYADMFRWQIVDITSTARYVKIIKTSGFLELREISFFDENNKIISIQSTQLFKDNKSVLNASYLFDEQQLAPEETTYMSDMYFDEIYHARTAYEYINKIYPYEITHPPFGKSIISLGIRIFGMNPFGWRFMGALCGIMMLPIIYVFSKRIFKKTLWASVTCILFALDFMHYTLTRIATIDSYSLFFILLMYLFMYEYTQHNFFNEKLTRTLIPLGLCGISFAFGAATKWICLYAGLGLAIIFFYTIFQRIIEYGVLKDISDNRAALFKKNVILTLVFCVAVFIIIPIAIYCLSYLPYESASKSSFGITGILENQKYMLNYHSYLKTDSPHPYSSSAYSWPFDIRPVYFFASEGLASNMRSVIWCFGNPILWLSAIASIIYIVAKRNDMHLNICGLPFISICALCQFLPNTMITREMFIYHYFTITPFLIIIIVFVLRHLYENYRSGKYIVIVYIVLNCIMFTAFYPVITGIPINYSYAKMLQWFKTWPL